MNQKPLENLSLDHLCKVVRPNDKVALSRHCMVAKLGTEYPSSVAEMPCRVDAVTFWCCLKGKARLSYNMHEYAIERGSFVVIPPNSIVELHREEELPEGYVMMIDPRYMQDVGINFKKIIAVMISGNVRHGAWQLDEVELDRMQKALELAFVTVANEAQTPFRDDVVQAMIKLLLYQSCELVTAHHGIEEAPIVPTTRAEEYFRRFVKTLNEHFMERQPVTFYADQLCISSRYLTTIVRRVSGYSVSEWMNRYVMAEAKQLLKYSEMSIQEIAYALNFPNQSFFGKYFKQHAGVSPSAYRQL